jgi:hypothetical protein
MDEVHSTSRARRRARLIKLGGVTAGVTAAALALSACSSSSNSNSSGGGTSNLFAYDAYANMLHKRDAANPPSARDGCGHSHLHRWPACSC